MSPVSSAENSPVKSESSERSPGVSPKRSPGRSPVQQPSGGSPRKSPKKPQDNSPRKSPGSFRTTTARHNEQSSALNGQPVQLFQNPVPVLEPFALPNGKNEKNKKQEAPSGEQSPASAKSEPIYTTPYMLSSQYRTDQAFATPSQVYPSMLVPYVDTSLMQNSSTLQFGPVLAPPNHDRHSNLTSFELEWGKVPEMDQAQTLSTWESPETTAAQHVTANEGDLTTLTTPLALRAASSPENGTNGLNKAHGAQSFPPSSSARRNTTTAKTILFPIQELSHANSVTPNLPILTPGSSFTLDSQGSQTTPSTAEPSSPARSQIFSNGSARPSSSLSTQSSPSTRAGVLTQKPEGFFWQLDSHGFPCAASGCDQRCNLWDGTTVICPKCGPYSEIRYCSKDHLLEDVKWHWLYCGQATFEHPCRENSIPQEVRDGVPLIPCIHPYDTPERHRQAVYFNVCAGEGDYFIFADWVDMLEPKVMDNNQALRCSSHVVHVVTFDDPVEKDRFRRVLATCLFSEFIVLLSDEMILTQSSCSDHRSTQPSRLHVPSNPRQPPNQINLDHRPLPSPKPPTHPRTLRPNSTPHHRRKTRLPNRLGRPQPPRLQRHRLPRRVSPFAWESWGYGPPPTGRSSGGWLLDSSGGEEYSS